MLNFDPFLEKYYTCNYDGKKGNRTFSHLDANDACITKTGVKYKALRFASKRDMFGKQIS